ncbi:hypothetical protein FGD77_10845 [Roseovarius sp. M141]|nr:hypothetical protein [Roseovarius sp. M141]
MLQYETTAIAVEVKRLNNYLVFEQVFGGAKRGDLRMLHRRKFHKRALLRDLDGNGKRQS